MTAGPAWSVERAEGHLASLERFGMRLGLERMRELLDRLGSPERAYPAIHVVGTNGKSSTTRYAAALLEAEGLRAAAYLSPHLVRWAERIRIAGEDLAPAAFAAAVQRAAQASAQVGGVSQFELITGAAFAAFAHAGVDAAVVEAGLGGRLDATNVLDSRVTVLTSVALEHTEHLGDSLAQIAREKLAVVRPGSTLVTGPLPDAAEDEVARLGVRTVRVPAASEFRETNLALAAAAVEAFLGRPLSAPPATIPVPGRLEVVSRDPLTLLDGAHNPAGMAALAAALPIATEGRRPLVGVVSVLGDKNAEAMLAALAPLLDRLVTTRTTNPRALDPEVLAGLTSTPAEVVAVPPAALTRARALAGPDGAVLATGSIHLIADLVAPEGSRAPTSY